MSKLCLRVAISLLLVTSVAGAQSPVTTLKQFDLFGTWALNCSQPAGPTNAYVDVVLTSGGAIELRDDFGADYDMMVYRVIEATRLSHFRLGLRQVLTTDERIALDTVTLQAAGRIRNWSSSFVDGSGTLVENGIVSLTKGRETDWLNRCDQRRADTGKIRSAETTRRRVVRASAD